MEKSVDESREHMRGVAVGPLTPFDEGGSIRHDDLAANARQLYSEGARTFLAAANISEYHSLTEDERAAVAETSVEALPDDACVLAGVGGATSEATDLVQLHESVGVDATMVMPPDHTYVHERGLLEYYRELASATDRPLAPYIRGFDPSVRFPADLTRVEGVVGIKYALADPVKLGASVAAGADDVVRVDGLTEPYAVSFWSEGAEGFSAGVSNFRPEVGLALHDALRADDRGRARALRNACLPFQRFRDGAGNDIPGAVSVPAVKKGPDLAGLTGDEVRGPLRPLSAEEVDRVERLYDELDDAIDRFV